MKDEDHIEIEGEGEREKQKNFQPQECAERCQYGYSNLTKIPQRTF